MVTPPIFCAGYRANRSATASAHLPPKYPSCRGVTQDFAKSFRGQHGQPKYLSRRAVVIGKPTKELNGTSSTMLGMRHSSCRRPKRSANGPEAHQCPLLAQSGHAELHCTCPLLGVERTRFDGQLRLCLRRNGLLKISRPLGPEKTRWGKQWGKQLIAGCRVCQLRHVANCQTPATRGPIAA